MTGRERSLEARTFRFPARDGAGGPFSALVHKDNANGALARMQEEWEQEVAMQRKVNDRLRISWREDVPAELVRDNIDVLRARVSELEAHLYDEQNLVGHLQRALHQIAAMPTKPRADGTFNYSREALIDIARRATKEPTDV